MCLSTIRSLSQHNIHTRGGIFSTVMLSHHAKVGRGCLQKYNCRTITSSVCCMTGSAVLFEHLSSRVRSGALNFYDFQGFLVWRLRCLRALPAETRSTHREQQCDHRTCEDYRCQNAGSSHSWLL